MTRFITKLVCVYLLVKGAPEHMNISMQKKRKDIANALELRLVCFKPSI